jgi:hypothetical protein
VFPDVHTEGKVGLGLHGQVRLDSSWPAGIYTLMLRMRPRLPGFIEPCLPSPAPNPPAGVGWIHEIKLDGFRLLARRDAAGVRLLTRRGIDWTTRYPSIASNLQPPHGRDARCDFNRLLPEISAPWSAARSAELSHGPEGASADSHPVGRGGGRGRAMHVAPPPWTASRRGYCFRGSSAGLT